MMQPTVSAEPPTVEVAGGEPEVDLLIVGAGPVGLYGTYYAGFRGLSVAVLDSLPEPGGQISALYPEKSIRDVAGFASVRGQELVDRLVEQAASANPRYLLGQEATELHRDGDLWRVGTRSGLAIRGRAVLITAGVGSITPRPLPCAPERHPAGLMYFVPRLDVFDGADVVVIGGGDSAVDWALEALPRANSVCLVHRRSTFRASAQAVQQLRRSRCRLILDAEVTKLCGAERVEAVELRSRDEQQTQTVKATVVVAALGFIMRLGPIANWGLPLQGKKMRVDGLMRTGLPGVFAAGDIVTYEGKIGLISVGFGEAAIAVNAAAAELRPNAGLMPMHSTALDQVGPVASVEVG